MSIPEDVSTYDFKFGAFIIYIKMQPDEVAMLSTDEEYVNEHMT
jgi:hypothetical protein